MEKLCIKLLQGTFGVARLNKEEAIPSWGRNNEFYSLTCTTDEISIVCLAESIPKDVQKEGDWRVFKVLGPLDFSLVGILARISEVMAENSISIFAISTYDTDYILVKEERVQAATVALRNAGYEIL